MIIILKKDANKKQIKNITEFVKQSKLKPISLRGKERTIIAAVGDEKLINREALSTLSGVESTSLMEKPYQLASIEAKKSPSKVRVSDLVFGGKNIVVMAGPCAVESEEQLITIAKGIKNVGAKVLRGGAFKPRSGPYFFQGLQEKGLKYLAKAKKVTGLKIITEVLDPRHVKLVKKYTDILQVGTRNMQNYPLLREVGKANIPVLLKRGMSASYEEFLLSAEYIMSQGNREVILCERGIRTFETHTRNTLDIGAVPALKELTHLPIIVDPSHGCGKRSLVASLSKAAVAAGADGILIEVHINPEDSKVDADQTISMKEFQKLMPQLKKIAIINQRVI